MDIVIKKVGDKLRTLRKELGLKQDDLVKHKISSGSKETPFTRNLISMVETDKAPLTKNLAAAVHKNLLIACEERRIPANFNFDEVCATPEDQIKKHICNYIDNLCKVLSLEESIIYAEKLIELAENHKLFSSLADLYISLGDLCLFNDTELTLKYYSKASVLKSELSDKRTLEISNLLKYTYIKLGRYDEALNIKYINIPEYRDIVFKCQFNDILCLKKLGRFNDACTEITSLRKLLNKDDVSVNIKVDMLEANISDEKNDSFNSMRIYKSLLEKSNSSLEYIPIKCNLLTLKIDSGTITQIELDEFSKSILPEGLPPYKVTLFYMTLSKGYKNFDLNKSVEYLIKSVKYILSQNEISQQNKAYYNELMNTLLSNEETMKLFFENFDEDFKFLISSSISRDLIDMTTLLKVMLYFQEREEYTFVNALIKKKIS